MTHPETPPRTAAAVCPSCDAPLSGRFCSRCGAAAGAPTCPACQTELSPGARFCHRCGAPATRAGGTGGRERLAWSLTGLAAVVALLAFLYRGNRQPSVPDMGNAGNVNAAGAVGAVPPLAQRAPDISNMTPRERFDRLWDRVVRAAEAGDSVTVMQFSPMALGAYSMMEDADADARYHAATIDLVIGDLNAALALADTIQADAPGHLLGYVIRGEVADRRNEAQALARSYKDFLNHYDAELKTGRTEYAEHKPILDDFKTRAQASLGQ